VSLAAKTAQAPVDQGSPSDGIRRRLPSWSARLVPDIAAFCAYVVAAIAVMSELWAHPNETGPAHNHQDHAFFTWVLAHAARSVTHLENPLFTNRINVPDGVNLMANTSILGIGIPLTPVTLLWGPAVAFLVATTIGFAGTAYAWYHVLSRHVVRSRLAAFVAAAFIGFMPGMLSQAQAHPNLMIQFLVPFIMWRVFRLPRSTRPVRDGVVLGLLIIWQVFISEEILLMLALVCLLIVLVYLALRFREALAMWRPFATGLAVAAGVALVVIAYPLYQQFVGPQSYVSLNTIGAKIGSYTTFSMLTVGGTGDAGLALAHNATELNANFGWPLVLVAVAIGVLLRKRLAAVLALVVGVVAVVCSLGNFLWRDGDHFVPGPWAVFHFVPVIKVAQPMRFGLVVGGAIGVLLAMAIDEIIHRRRGEARWVLGSRVVAAVAILAALVPLVPRPQQAAWPPAAPRFLADGTWRRYVTGDETIMIVPPTFEMIRDSMRWAGQQKAEYRLVYAYFLGPKPGSADREGEYDTPLTSTEQLLRTAGENDRAVATNDSDRAQARETVRMRDAAVVVLPLSAPGADSVRTTLTDLIGAPKRVDDVWVWDTRPLLTD
jgi:hypothetical protein